jgi:hypothetical protein
MPSRKETIAAAILLVAMVFYVWLMSGCGRTKPHDPEPTAALDQKRAVYLAQIPSVQDQHGFVDTDECDSLMHSALIGATGGVHVDVMAAEDPAVPGRFYRRPVSYPECHAAGASRSTISRDMLLGVFWYAWARRDLAMVERIWDYGKGRNWVMGEDRIGGNHTIMTPVLIGTLAKLIERLGGASHSEQGNPAFFGGCEGYECQLAILQILLRGELWGGISDHARGVLNAAAARQRTNPLAQFAKAAYGDGNQDETVRLMLELPRYPSNHLPTSADVCDRWPMQRDDDGSSMTPCPENNHVHSGGDWLFVAWLLTKGNP